MEIIQLLDGEYLLHGAFEIIFEPDEMHFVLLDKYVAGLVVLIPGLSNGADIDDGLFVIENRIDVVQLVRQVEIGFVKEHADVLAARVKREVTNKLTTGLKNPRRR